MHGCHAFVPALVCAHADQLLYLLPTLALALLLHLLSRASPVWFLLLVSGTICHELAHFSVGLLAGARPTGLTIVPRRVGRHWRLGAVTLGNMRWYNAAPVALAPLLLLAIPLGVAWWRTRHPWHYQPLDLLLALLVAPQCLSFWPSATDWKLAWRSWPCLLVIALAAGAVSICKNPAWRHGIGGAFL
jgi:hypothetical protein